jgi:DNA primase
VLEHYGVRLKRVHDHYLRGRCPLPTHSSEQSRESFAVHTCKNVWACQSASCRKARQGRVGGNILDLVAWLEECSIREAALRLVEWGAPAGTADQRVSKGRNVDGCQPELPRLPFSLRVRDGHPYLEQRGISRQTAALFGVGYYVGRGFLQGRIVFPIHNAEGELIAYAGRSLEGSGPRYLFPAGFRKSAAIFNLHRAIGSAASATRRAVVVEGFFDCLKVHQAGHGTVVALMGASLSDVQAKLLEQHFRELILMLDGDEAGRRASRMVAAQLRGRMPLRIAWMPEGRQPDQLSDPEIQRILDGRPSLC